MKIIPTLIVFTLFCKTLKAQEVPFSTNEAKVCKEECIDAGYSFCPLSNYGLCCKQERCDMTYCSHDNSNIGARYLSCV